MSNQTYQQGDLLLLNRGADSHTSPYGDVKSNILDSHIIQSPTPPDLTSYPDLVDGTIWVDTGSVPPVVNIWGGNTWNPIEGGSGTDIAEPDPITDIDIQPPAGGGGSGTIGDPFVLNQVTSYTVGGSVETENTITIKNQSPGAFVIIDTLQGGVRFEQNMGFCDSNGEWTGKFYYKDTPDSTAGETYEAKFKIGAEAGTFFDWSVIQVVNQTPIVGGDGTTTAPNASPPSVENDVDKLYGTGTATWADGAGTLRSASTTRSGITDAILFGVNGGSIDKTDKAIADGQEIEVIFDGTVVDAANHGDKISGALTNDAGFYQEWSMTKDTVANAWSIDPLVDQPVSTTVQSTNVVIEGINAQSQVDLIFNSETLANVMVSVNGAAFTAAFPVSFNPGDTLQFQGDTGSGTDTEYVATFSVGGTEATWSVTTVDVEAVIVQPTITSPLDGAVDLIPEVTLVSSAYDDAGTGAGTHTSSTWEVYESAAKAGVQTSAIIAGGVVDESTWNQDQTWSTTVTKTGSWDGWNYVFNGENALSAYMDNVQSGTFTFPSGLTGSALELCFNQGSPSRKTRVTINGNTLAFTEEQQVVQFDELTFHDCSSLLPANGDLSNLVVSLRLENVSDDNLVSGSSLNLCKIKVDSKLLVDTGIAGAGSFTKLTFTDDRAYETVSNGEVDTIDQIFKEGDKVVAKSNQVDLSKTYYSEKYTRTGYWDDVEITSGIDNENDNTIFWTKKLADSGSSQYHGIGFKKVPGKVLETALNVQAKDYPEYLPLEDGAFFDTSEAPAQTIGLWGDQNAEYIAYNFKCKAGFMDVQTYTAPSYGVGSTENHDLGVVPGAIIYKCTSDAFNWIVYHKEVGPTGYLKLNSGNDTTIDSTAFNDTAPTSTQFTAGTLWDVSRSNEEFVAWLFADEPDNGIKCGKYPGNGSNQVVPCGFKPAWLLIKGVDNNDGWALYDNKRTGYLSTDNARPEKPGAVTFVDNGFSLNDNDILWNAGSKNYVYIAISESAFGPPTGVLTADADKDSKSMTLTDVTGEWKPGLTAVGEGKELAIPAPSSEPPDAATYTKVVDAVDDTSNLTSYDLGDTVLQGGKAYHSRVKYKDDTAPDAIESEFSPYNSFSVREGNIDLWLPAQAAEDNRWFSVTYGNGKFVAVSNDGTHQVMHSADGIDWEPASAANVNQWESVTYGDGKFVAVASGGSNHRVMYSEDGGDTWTAVEPPEDIAWWSVTYADNKFVAVAAATDTNSVMHSPDGVTWTMAVAAEGNYWRSVTYGNNKFVAVSDNGTNRVMHSPDGITWTSASAAEGNYWRSVTFGNNKFVAVSKDGTNRVMHSTDGITWTSASAAADNSWRSVTYGDGKFVAVAYSGTANRIMYSANAIDWTPVAAPQDNSWASVTYGDGKFVAVSYDGTDRVMYSFA